MRSHCNLLQLIQTDDSHLSALILFNAFPETDPHPSGECAAVLQTALEPQDNAINCNFDISLGNPCKVSAEKKPHKTYKDSRKLLGFWFFAFVFGLGFVFRKEQIGYGTA